MAALVAAQWLEQDGPLGLHASQLRCIGYGMPAVASPKLGSALRHNIVAVVCGTDMVPRFSLGSAVRLRDAVLALWREPELVAKALSTEDAPAAREMLTSLYGSSERIEALCPPGRVVWVAREGCQVTVVDDPGVSFRDLSLVGAGAFETHLPQNYAARLAAI